jgi:RepB plasmid partitioning protein/ParB-like nuclease domain
MQPSVKIGFRQELLDLPLECLLALKETGPNAFKERKYKQLEASLQHVGLIEPLAVFPQAPDRFLVINGNLRLHILRKLEIPKARCTVALDDESYTYNRRVNALSPITEHFMILKAIANGVTEERIAVGLCVDVKTIKQRRSLLDGICPEAVELLKDKRVSSRIFYYLRRMKPLRQIDAAELMVSGKNYSLAFAASILAVTRPEQLIKPEKRVEPPETAVASSVLEETTDSLLSELVIARKTYGSDVLTLSVICRCIENLSKNGKVVKYLQQNHSGILGELQHLVSQVNAERVATQ